MIHNPLSGRIDMDRDECELLSCAMRKFKGFLRIGDYYMLLDDIWNETLHVECIPAATKILRLWNIEAQYSYANKMVKELEELVTHIPEWEENLKKMLAREKDVGNQHPVGDL